ncbi:hypothetical protein Q4567_22045 [Aliiglaciecola sp. 2_MG-2023]|uniref:hypothetical protein n=1 Tax=unclassified Aliiglaciecola TaxID=2593648 RepID=UPI0026E49269|nr:MULTISPECIES: hypothetical protein [unclassified Aliiglaciecola]MDO6713422.1 hypothetical protein [Aliiglaciecola sp. 2_MG-2023]MDO6754558.1 hypothetical protein [Aliiglaciecola sp. 1_MG-2023]
MAKLFILLLISFSCYSRGEGVPVWLFDKTILLPSNCTFAVHASVNDESNVRFICESSDMNEKEDAWIWFLEYKAKNVEGLRSESSVRNFAVEELGNLMYYSFLTEEYGVVKTKSDMVCDDEICIHIVGSLKSEVSNFVISQLQ